MKVFLVSIRENCSLGNLATRDSVVLIHTIKANNYIFWDDDGCCWYISTDDFDVKQELKFYSEDAFANVQNLKDKIVDLERQLDTLNQAYERLQNEKDMSLELTDLKSEVISLRQENQIIKDVNEEGKKIVDQLTIDKDDLLSRLKYTEAQLKTNQDNYRNLESSKSYESKESDCESCDWKDSYFALDEEYKTVLKTLARV